MDSFPSTWLRVWCGGLTDAGLNQMTTAGKYVPEVSELLFRALAMPDGLQVTENPRTETLTGRSAITAPAPRRARPRMTTRRLATARVADII